MCWSARSPSSRSASIRAFPVRNTSSGILRLVLKPVVGSVVRSRDRPSLNSSSVSSPASMMNPRSAPPTAMAESMTSASTSSSTLPELRARSPSSSTATWCISPIAVTLRVSSVAPSDSRNTSSAPPLRPSFTWSPCRSRRVLTSSPLTNVPYLEPRLRISNPSPTATISAWPRDTSPLGKCRSLVTRRPMTNGSFSISMIRRPSWSVTSSVAFDIGFPVRRPPGLRCFLGHMPPACSRVAPCAGRSRHEYDAGNRPRYFSAPW